jgi:Mrp family chromosome partitioning ATPase/capsular polysaccharide biosynthesis protein
LTYVYYERKPPVYQSSATLLVGTSQVAELLRETPPIASDRTLNNQAALMNSEQFALAVRERLRRQRRPVEGFSAAVMSGDETDLLAIEAASSSPQMAARAANEYAREYVERRKRQIRGAYQAAITATRRQIVRMESSLERRAAAERLNELETLASVADPNAELIDVAQPSVMPVAPRPRRNAVFAFVLGLVLGSGLVLLASRLDRRIRSLSEAEDVFQRPVLAAIPQRRMSKWRLKGREPLTDMREPLRRLLTTLELDRDPESRTRKILVTSAQKGEGKSIVVCHLALVAREAGLRVAVVDTDLQSPGQAQLLEVETVPGLSDILAGRVPLDEAWQRVGTPALHPVGVAGVDVWDANSSPWEGEIEVLTSGTRTHNPSAPIASPEMPFVLGSRDGEVDYVFVDAPPPLAVSDALPLLSSVDAIVVVSMLGQTTHIAAHRLMELLEQRSTAPVVGVVANGVPEDQSAAFGFVSEDRYAA